MRSSTTTVGHLRSCPRRRPSDRTWDRPVRAAVQDAPGRASRRGGGAGRRAGGGPPTSARPARCASDQRRACGCCGTPAIDSGTWSFTERRRRSPVPWTPRVTDFIAGRHHAVRVRVRSRSCCPWLHGQQHDWERSARRERLTQPVAVDLLATASGADPARHGVDARRRSRSAPARRGSRRPNAGYSFGARRAAPRPRHPGAQPRAGEPLGGHRGRAARADRGQAPRPAPGADSITAFTDHWESLPLFATERAPCGPRRRCAPARNDPLGLAANLRRPAPCPAARGPAWSPAVTVIGGALDRVVPSGVGRHPSASPGVDGAGMPSASSLQVRPGARRPSVRPDLCTSEQWRARHRPLIPVTAARSRL
jgi:hypothetical protein